MTEKPEKQVAISFIHLSLKGLLHVLNQDMCLGNLQKFMKVILVPVPIFGKDIFIYLPGCLAFCFLQCEVASLTVFQNHQNKGRTRIKLNKLMDTFPKDKEKMFNVWSRERTVHNFIWFLIFFMFPLFPFFAVW